MTSWRDSWPLPAHSKSQGQDELIWVSAHLTINIHEPALTPPSKVCIFGIPWSICLGLQKLLNLVKTFEEHLTWDVRGRGVLLRYLCQVKSWLIACKHGMGSCINSRWPCFHQVWMTDNLHVFNKSPYRLFPTTWTFVRMLKKKTDL